MCLNEHFLKVIYYRDSITSKRGHLLLFSGLNWIEKDKIEWSWARAKREGGNDRENVQRLREKREGETCGKVGRGDSGSGMTQVVRGIMRC